MAVASSQVDIWVGSSLGIMKGVSLDPLRYSNYMPGGLALSQTDKSREMLRMCREADGRDGIYVALRSGVVQAFSCAQRQFTAECDVTGGEGTLVGVGRRGNCLITCTDEGALCFWPPEREKWVVDVGPRVCAMATNPLEDLQVATGGRENPLKLWDGHHTEKPLFIAKNVRPDKLDLRVPVWVNEVGFAPDSGPHPVLVVGTGHGHVRLYDTAAQRRPVYSTQHGTEPITALDITPDGRYYVVGNSIGELASFDLRKGALVSQYKGFGGAVCAVQCGRDGHSPVLAACGLDRYLRVYQMERPRLLHQLYLKLQCKCLLFDASPTSQVGTESAAVQEASREAEGSSGEESGGDDVWAAMETVGDEKLKARAKRHQPAWPTDPAKRRKKTSKLTKNRTAQTVSSSS